MTPTDAYAVVSAWGSQHGHLLEPVGRTLVDMFAAIQEMDTDQDTATLRGLAFRLQEESAAVAAAGPSGDVRFDAYLATISDEIDRACAAVDRGTETRVASVIASAQAAGHAAMTSAAEALQALLDYMAGLGF